VILAVDFDGTCVERQGPDPQQPLRLRPGAKRALQALRAAGHVLFLSSSRANRSLREDPHLDPLVTAGARPLDRAAWQRQRAVHEQRYQQMREFVQAQLPGLFAAIDDGRQGKPLADLYLDDRGVRVGAGALGALDWQEIAETWGASRVYAAAQRGA